MLENSKMSYNIFERGQKCWTVFPTLLMIFFIKQTFNMLYNILSNFRTFGRSKMRHRVRFVKNNNSFYTEFLFMVAKKRSNKKWQDGEIEKLIDFYEENPCLRVIFDNSYQKQDVKERALAAVANGLGVQIIDIKSKWNAIRGQFGRELSKVKSSKSRQSNDDLYVSQWMFWDKLQFLQSVMKTTKSRDTLSIGNESFQINASSDEESNDIGKKPTPKAKPPKGKKKKIEDAKTELLVSCFNVLKEPSAAPSAEPKEEIDHFSFHTAGKLKTVKIYKNFS